MKPAPHILTLNGGSSSIRFAVYEAGASPRQILSGKIDRIGLPGTNLTVVNPPAKPGGEHELAGADHREAADYLLDWLGGQTCFLLVGTVGHRVVHGMRHSEPERITPELLAELRRITPYAPDHLPIEIGLIEAFRKRHPKMTQFACFDTAFHRSMPKVAKMLPIPRSYGEAGVERYGFHGLSYSYLVEELGRLDPLAARGRVILAHLGNGASLAAVREGMSIDTSMGFTPAAGVMMSTRSGDLDPGLVYYLARTGRMTSARFNRMANRESGLLGVSGTSSDMRDLLAREDEDAHAAEAVALFCYQVKKWIGSFAAALGGLDTLVFSGGIGENAPAVRARVCEGLGFLGIALHKSRNGKSAGLISSDTSRVTVRVIATDEESMIARLVWRSRTAGIGK